ncbi:hypothetical protein BJ508DRAFT_412237 [Ascobolus immersus RN42]|uniref:F-box domain-containing protein n=1 Tax=Ascobolus immersus RN42 TaxID=1160509 RepID=A0A3N4IK83_ASCIM|nr:hypothetical protein BJ508DRAFT_412237 [Ascobolus immersus RN42]
MPPATITLVPNEIVLQIFRGVQSVSSFLNLSQTCRRFYEVAKANESIILRDVAASSFLPEAIRLLDQQRFSTMSPVELAYFRMNCTNKSDGNWLRERGGLLRDRGQYSSVEMQLLQRDEKAVDALVEEACETLTDVNRVAWCRNRHSWGGRYNDFDETVASGDRLEIKRAIYLLHILMAQFRLAGIEGLVDYREASSTDIYNLLFTDPSKLHWIYDYSFAACMTTKALFEVLGLARYLFYSGWVAIDMLLCHSPGNNSNFQNASLKRFAFVNLFNTSTVDSVIQKSRSFNDLGGMYRILYNEAWKEDPESSRDTYLKIFTEFRNRPKVGIPPRKWNPRIFQIREHQVQIGSEGGFVGKKLLVVKAGGWNNMTEMEKMLVGDHEAEEWMYEDQDPDYGSDAFSSDDEQYLFDSYMDELDGFGGFGGFGHHHRCAYDLDYDSDDISYW